MKAEPHDQYSSVHCDLSDLHADLADLRREERYLRDEIAELKARRGQAWDEALEKATDQIKPSLRMLIDELRPVLELAWRADPSLVEYHLRRLDIDPTVELAAVKHEASGGRTA
jgi:chromosome segregation ATPase